MHAGRHTRLSRGSTCSLEWEDPPGGAAEGSLDDDDDDTLCTAAASTQRVTPG